MRLIDAEALKVNFEANTPVAFQDMIPGIHYIIDRARTIDAVPVKHGKWIKAKNSLWSVATCSECGYINVDARNYCTNCGADMRERKES